MESEKFFLPTALILGLVVANDASVANAAYVFDNNAAVTEIAGGLSGFGTTFQTQVSNLSKGLLASAKIIAVIMTALGRDSVAWFVSEFMTGRKYFGIGYWE